MKQKKRERVSKKKKKSAENPPFGPEAHIRPSVINPHCIVTGRSNDNNNNNDTTTTICVCVCASLAVS